MSAEGTKTRSPAKPWLPELTFAHHAGELARQVPLGDEAGARLGFTPTAAAAEVGAGRGALALGPQEGALWGAFLAAAEGLDGRHDHLVQLLQGEAQITALQHVLGGGEGESAEVRRSHLTGFRLKS